MSNKSTDLLQHSYAIMVNDDSDYRPLNIADDTILSSDYEPGNLFLNFMFTKSNGKMKRSIVFTSYIIYF